MSSPNSAPPSDDASQHTALASDQQQTKAQPSLEAEVAEYAEYLGLEPAVDSELLWVAESALLSPPPPGWKVVYDHTKRPFFLHAESGETMWEHPFDADWRALADGLRHALKNEPVTKEDVQDMARYLGLNTETEPMLAWIAQHASAAPLPPPWVEREVEGQHVFVNGETGHVQSDHPLDETFRTLLVRERARVKAGIFSFARAGAVGTDSGRCLMRLWDEGPDAQPYIFDWVSGKRVNVGVEEATTSTAESTPAAASAPGPASAPTPTPTPTPSTPSAVPTATGARGARNTAGTPGSGRLTSLTTRGRAFVPARKAGSAKAMSKAAGGATGGGIHRPSADSMFARMWTAIAVFVKRMFFFL